MSGSAIGIDIGTSAVKAVLAEGDRVIAECSVPLTTANPHPGWSQQDPEAWWAATLAAVNGLPGRAAARAVGLSGQMHGAVCLGRGGRPLRPAILWNDGRAGAEAAELATRRGIAGRAGVVPMAGLTAPKLMWMARHEPRKFAAIETILSPKDYIGFRLHGGFATDTSDAAGTLWFDQAARRWSPRLADAGGIDPGLLPTVLRGDEVAGMLTRAAADELGLRHGLPVVAGAGDTVAGTIGAGLIHPGDCLLGLGTSGQVLVETDAYLPVGKGVHAFAHTLDGLWYRMGALLNGARPIAWFAGVLGRPVAEALALAETAGPELPLFLPYLSGERTPFANAALRAGFSGLSDDTGAAEMMQAVIEGVAYGFAEARDALVEGGLDYAAPVALGGGARGDAICQTMANVLQTEIHRPANSGTGAALGAARLALLGVSGLSLADIGRPETDRIFIPDPTSTDRHQARRAAFRKAVRDATDG